MRNRLVRSRGSALVHKSLVCERGRSADDVLVSRTVAPELSDSAPVHVVKGSSRMPPPDNRGRPAEQHPRGPSFSPPWLLLPTNLSLSLSHFYESYTAASKRWHEYSSLSFIRESWYQVEFLEPDIAIIVYISGDFWSPLFNYRTWLDHPFKMLP